MPPQNTPPPWLRLAVALAPLGLCLALGWGVAGDVLGFGGGEKDILLLLPLALWALVFALASLALWARGMAPGRASAMAALIGLALTAAAVAALLFGFAR